MIPEPRPSSPVTLATWTMAIGTPRDTRIERHCDVPLWRMKGNLNKVFKKPLTFDLYISRRLGRALNSPCSCGLVCPLFSNNSALRSSRYFRSGDPRLSSRSTASRKHSRRSRCSSLGCVPTFSSPSPLFGRPSPFSPRQAPLSPLAPTLLSPASPLSRYRLLFCASTGVLVLHGPLECPSGPNPNPNPNPLDCTDTGRGRGASAHKPLNFSMDEKKTGPCVSTSTGEALLYFPFLPPLPPVVR